MSKKVSGENETESILSADWVSSARPKVRQLCESDLARQDVVAQLWHHYHNFGQVLAEYNANYQPPLTLPVLKQDIRTLRERWLDERDQELGVWQAEELAYALTARAFARDLFRNDPHHPIVYGRLEGEWTKRIADLMGLDAARKTENLNLNVNAATGEISIFKHGDGETKLIESADSVTLDGTTRLQATNNERERLEGVCETGVRGDDPGHPGVPSSCDSVESL